MLEAISAPAGRSHVLGPADLTASAVFDLSGNVLKGTFDTPRFIFDLDVSSELSLSISHGQMDVLKELGGALGRAETRKRYESCDRPNSRVPVRPFEDVEERTLRGPNLAARRWWRYAKECVLFDWREEHGKTMWRDVVSKARVQEEYIRALEEEHTIRFTRDYHRRLSTYGAGGGALASGNAATLDSVSAARAAAAAAAAAAAEMSTSERSSAGSGSETSPVSSAARMHATRVDSGQRSARLAALEAQLDVDTMLHCRRRANIRRRSLVPTPAEGATGNQSARLASAMHAMHAAGAQDDAAAAARSRALSRAIDGEQLLDLRRRLDVQAEDGSMPSSSSDPVDAEAAAPSDAMAAEGTETSSGSPAEPPSQATREGELLHAYVLMRATFRISAVAITLCGAGVDLSQSSSATSRPAQSSSLSPGRPQRRRDGPQPLVKVRVEGIDGSVRFRPRHSGLGIQATINDLGLYNLATPHAEVCNSIGKGSAPGSAAHRGPLIALAIDTAPLGSDAAAMMRFEIWP